MSATMGLRDWDRAVWRQRLEGAGADTFERAEAARYLRWSHVPDFAEFPAWKDRRVLEIGCGSGIEAVNFARAGADYTGIVWAESEQAGVIERLESAGLRGRVVVGDPAELERLDVGDSFDLVFCGGPIASEPRAEVVVKAAERWMTPEGELRMILAAKQSWGEISGRGVMRYGRGEVRKILGSLELVRMEQSEIGRYQAAGKEAGRYELEPWFAAMPGTMVAALEEKFGSHLMVWACPAGRKGAVELAMGERQRVWAPPGPTGPPTGWQAGEDELVGEDALVFAEFEAYAGEVPVDFKIDFLGMVTDRNVSAGEFVQATSGHPQSAPERDKEYFEWIEGLESVRTAGRRYTMLEVGAGYGRWSCRAALAARQRGIEEILVGAVEAEPSHRRWIEPHYLRNGLRETEYRIFPVAVAAEPGRALFYINEPGAADPEKAAKDWYGQMLAGNDGIAEAREDATYHGLPVVTLDHGYQAVEVEVAAFTDILAEFEFLDLVDFDIQGRELEVIAASIHVLDAKVRMVYVGTHGRDLEVGLRAIFRDHGWECRRDLACYATHETEYGRISLEDGVQSWRNPRFPTGGRE